VLDRTGKIKQQLPIGGRDMVVIRGFVRRGLAGLNFFSLFVAKAHGYNAVIRRVIRFEKEFCLLFRVRVKSGKASLTLLLGVTASIGIISRLIIPNCCGLLCFELRNSTFLTCCFVRTSAATTFSNCS
jgi:hypothetical protein